MCAAGRLMTLPCQPQDCPRSATFWPMTQVWQSLGSWPCRKSTQAEIAESGRNLGGMQRLFLSALALSLCGCGSAYCAPALSLAPTRPMILVRRTSPLLACATNEPPEQHAKIVASPSSNAATAWIEQNLLQGVNLNPSTYAVMVVYFVQGVLGLASLARTYFLKDQLGLSPAEATALMGITTLPWVIKPVYGFLSDGLPIFGYRRKPYLIIAGLLGSASWTSLATVVSTPTQAVVAATVASLGVAVSDVVVDSLVVERAREDETASSGALQSLCWSCQSLGALTSAYFSGSLLQTMSPQQVFAITAVFPLLVVLMALQLDEKRVVKTAKDTANGEGVSAGPFADFSELVSSQGSLLWGAISQRQVWLPTLFIALWQATPTSDGAFFYFITDELGIGPEFLGRVRVGTSLASLFGIWAYRTYLQEVELKKLFTGLSVAGAVLGSTQLLLVSRYNLVLGIPDTCARSLTRPRFSRALARFPALLHALARSRPFCLNQLPRSTAPSRACLTTPGPRNTKHARRVHVWRRPDPHSPRPAELHAAPRPRRRPLPPRRRRHTLRVAHVRLQRRGNHRHRARRSSHGSARGQRGAGRRTDRLHESRPPGDALQPLLAAAPACARIAR